MLEQLIFVGTDACVPAVRERLGSSDTRIQLTALAVLGRIETDGAVGTLIDALHSGNPKVVSRAATHMGRRRDQRFVAPLIALLGRPAESGGQHVRRSAAFALRRSPHSSAIPVLAVAARDPDAATRRNAAIALMMIRSPDARVALQDAVARLSWWRGRYARRALRRAVEP